MQTSVQRLARREWWLWFSSIVVTALAGTVLILSAFRSLFASHNHFYEISVAQARWTGFAFLLLFNIWMIHQLRLFRRSRTELLGQESAAEAQVNGGAAGPQDAFRLDSVTGLCTRTSFDHLLGKEVARSRRRNTPLSLVAIQLDDFSQFGQQIGASASDTVIKEFAARLRKASRGVDFAVRMGADGFLLALPECSLNDAKRVLDRVGNLEMEISGEDVTLTYSVGWIDYKPGEVPSDLIRRAEQVLKLYGTASEADASPTRHR